ncbi:hypothetical protein MAPG_01902 [Magnaporthiopsis poae ATCC 64411]|uniref:Uncharacterized protein n=1 Tax=Magnaporthiopsis poae (strain ATCC 64411 / 73-15) TaxID=644358 RepID=A0A0C4DPX2_MAGP6|nr:hypothetical protein MAPG_01902 [Magnaporthiopsis poae ATCC 64411]
MLSFDRPTGASFDTLTIAPGRPRHGWSSPASGSRLYDHYDSDLAAHIHEQTARCLQGENVNLATLGITND